MKLHTLEAKHIKVGYDKKEVINDLSVHIPNGKISVIIGANACGKSTLLKTYARLLQPKQGEILLDGKCIHKENTKTLAKIIGLLPQSSIAPEGICVSDLVARGRFPHLNFMGSLQETDYKAIQEALDMMKISDLADRNIDELSGGQRQRVWIAMALAQQTDILFLDEPTTYLDITYQIEILDLLKELNDSKKTTIVMVLHDINLSARYGDHIIALKQGRLVAQGHPNEVVNEQLINEVFQLNCMVIQDPFSNTPLIIPKGKHPKVI